MDSENVSIERPAHTQPDKPARAPSIADPTAEQLAQERSVRWHQDGNALLTEEALREWIQRFGLVLYAPRPQLGAPAPSVVEATLGKANAEPALAEFDAARSLLARLVADGSVVPLNLLGASGGAGTDQPDFVASAAVFSYIFTLRGVKAWKQPPTTSGAVKVSPLGLATYEMLTAKVTMSAYDLATQLGKEVTETAVLRALTELWTQLRVLPVPQQDGAATTWEPASARFTKQIKSGANAGQPSALSTLSSLYLSQAVLASEDEIESFLSPLAARSRVRDVLHAILAGRQLETLVIGGKTLLHVSGELPAFAGVALATEEGAAEGVEEEGEQTGSRIRKFAAKPASKLRTGLKVKPAYGAKARFADKPSFGDQGTDRERRPFKRAAGAEGTGEKRAFRPRPEGAAGPERSARADRPDRSARPDRPARPAFDRPWSEDRPARPAREGGERPARKFAARSDARPGKPYVKREGGTGGFDRKPRPSFERGGEGRPPRRDFAAGAEGGERPQRRTSGEGTGGPRAYGEKRAGKPFGARPASGAGKPAFGAKPGFGGKPAYGAGKPAFGGDRERPSRPRAESSEGGETARPAYRKFDAPRGPKPFARGPRAEGSGGPGVGSSERRPGAKFAGSRPPYKSAGDRPGAGFGSSRPPFKTAGSRPAFKAAGSKFAGSRPPFRADGPAGGRAGFKPGGKTFGGAKSFGGGKSFGGPKPFRGGAPKKAAPGGFAPVRRKREEGDES